MNIELSNFVVDSKGEIQYSFFWAQANKSKVEIMKKLVYAINNRQIKIP